MIRCVLSALALSLACITSSAYALDPIPQKPGLSGYIKPGGGVMEYKNNLVAGNSFLDLGQETIGSLTDDPDSENTGIFSLNFELAYTFAGSRSQLTLGSELSDLARLDFSQQLAFKHEFANGTLVSLGGLFSGIPTEVWSDPYVIGIPRQETDRSSTGARLVVDRLFGSGLEVTYSYRSIDIDEEKSGEFLGLSPAQRNLLRREGDNHKLELAYSMKPAQRHRLIPSVSYSVNDRDGDAMSNWAGDAQLTYVYFGNPVTLIVNGLVGMSEFDEGNPIYGKTQENDRYAANAQILYKNPFGWKPFGMENFSVWAAASYLREDANIDFYDTEVSALMAGVLVRL